ncbi:MAG: hypothetical protein ACU0BB_10685 [Paracoccaceae bacterium]
MNNNDEKTADEWLRRINDAHYNSLPHYEAKLHDEMFAVIKAIEVLGYAAPQMTRELESRKLEAYKKHNGNRSIDPDEMILRALCIASVNALMNAGATEEMARSAVAELSGQKKTRSRGGIATSMHFATP